MATQRKAIALISGGLDSMLATKLVVDQGVHVEGINFFTGFCVEGHTHAIRNHDRGREKRNNALWVAERLGIKLHIIDVIEEYKDIVINPKHGYGANLNPCLDCKSFMVGKARAWMEVNGFDFIITGEVAGQRPMSQRRVLMPIIERESGASDRLLRPLCAKILPPTLPEIEGWVDREKLGGITGRGRKKQIKLVKEYGITDYAQPAGGCCFLTNADYSNKLQDLWKTRGEKRYDFDDIMLLKVGRHIRPDPGFKLIISRDEGETNFLKGYKTQFTHMMAETHSGPLTLIQGDIDEQGMELAARITARYGKGRDTDQVKVKAVDTAGAEYHFQIQPLPKDQIPTAWYL